MEKLIELLNKFIKEKKHYHWTFENENEVSKYECLIISKQFKFIRRLVENDKIDRDKSKIITAKTEIVLGTTFTDGFVVTKRYWLYEQLLMILAIQNNPINFLISILE